MIGRLLPDLMMGCLASGLVVPDRVAAEGSSCLEPAAAAAGGAVSGQAGDRQPPRAADFEVITFNSGGTEQLPTRARGLDATGVPLGGQGRCRSRRTIR